MGFQVVIESQINISKSSQWFMQCQQDSCGYLLSHSLCFCWLVELRDLANKFNSLRQTAL